MRLIFCLRDKEKRKDYRLTSEWSVLAVDFQGIEVKPPMILLNSVLTMTIVLDSPSQSLWNSLIENSCSLALKSKWAWLMFRCSNNFPKKRFSSLPSTKLLPGSSRGFFNWTLISLRSTFLYYLLTDLLRVFLGVSSSVLTLDALRGSSKSGKEISF